jgi:hypothetical protein
MPKLGVPNQLLLCGPDVRFGSQADVRTAKRHVRFAPDSDQENDLSQKTMSALTPEADVCSALVYVG